jgi:hypothetical protein
MGIRCGIRNIQIFRRIVHLSVTQKDLVIVVAIGYVFEKTLYPGLKSFYCRFRLLVNFFLVAG